MAKAKNNDKKKSKEAKKNKSSLKFEKNGLLKRERKILKEAGVEYCLEMPGDRRTKRWQKEFLAWGFDSRDTWNLDVAMLEILLERLWLYRDIAPVDLTFHKVKLGKDEVTLGEAIDELISDLKMLLIDLDKYSCDEATLKKYDKIQRKIWKNWGIMAPYVWW